MRTDLNGVLRSAPFDLWDASIFLAYRGSIAHGTHLSPDNPNSIDDVDVFGICIAPPRYFFGIDTFEQFERKIEQWDVLVYEFRKFMRLLVKCNPNVLNALWTPRKHILKSTWQYDKLIEHRALFSSKAIYKAFGGYSYDQLRKMESMVHNGYMGEKRKTLVAKYGYDTKNAQHLIRLLRQGIEFLRTGELIVERPDAEELKQIKCGGWAIDKVHRVAKELFEELKVAERESSLPETIDRDAVNKLMVDILSASYSSVK